MTLSHDIELLRPLVDRMVELAALPVQAERKKLWADHQALRKTPRAPVSVYYEGIPTPQWKYMLGEDYLRCRDGLARTIELNLRCRLWVARNVPDDHILWPSVWVSYPRVEKQGWGVELAYHDATEELGAWAYDPPFKDGIDIGRLTQPRYEFDDAAGAEAIEKAHGLVEGRLRVNAIYGTMRYRPFDYATDMRGMQDLLMDAALDPENVYALNDFICAACEAHEEQREREGRINVWSEPESPYQEVEMRVHCAYQEPTLDQRAPKLLDEWTYLHAQTSAGLGPEQYAQFVQPFNERLARYFINHTVYYHGCEPLHLKMPVIARTPNLRRFHVSPWTDLERVVEYFQGRVVLEVHDHPGDAFLCATESQMRERIRSLFERAQGHLMDLNMSDIHTFNRDPALLTQWARLAREESERAAG